MQQSMHSAKEGEERKKLHLHSRFKGKARQEMAGQKCIQEERTYSGSGGEPDRERVVEEDDDVGGRAVEKKGSACNQINYTFASFTLSFSSSVFQCVFIVRKK